MTWVLTVLPPFIQTIIHTSLIEQQPVFSIWYDSWQENSTANGHIKSEKAAAPESIPVESLKLDLEATANILHVLLRKIWEEAQVPQTNWKEDLNVWKLQKAYTTIGTRKAFQQCCLTGLKNS